MMENTASPCLVSSFNPTGDASYRASLGLLHDCGNEFRTFIIVPEVVSGVFESPALKKHRITEWKDLKDLWGPPSTPSLLRTGSATAHCP